MAKHGEVQELIDRLREAEAEGRVDEDIIHMLECRGRGCISKTYLKKAKDAAKASKNDASFWIT
jgi:hypothetical protein